MKKVDINPAYNFGKWTMEKQKKGPSWAGDHAERDAAKIGG